MTYDIADDEAGVVREILETSHRELLLEIARAELHDFKAALQEREKLLRHLLEKFGVLESSHS